MLVKASDTDLLGQSKVVGVLTVPNGGEELVFFLWCHKVINGYETRQSFRK